jgi:hypothetical protein
MDKVSVPLDYKLRGVRPKLSQPTQAWALKDSNSHRTELEALDKNIKIEA